MPAAARRRLPPPPQAARLSAGALPLLLLALALVSCKPKTPPASPSSAQANDPAALVSDGPPPPPPPPAKSVTRVAILADSAVDPMRNYQTNLLLRLIRTRPGMETSLVQATGKAAIQEHQIREAVAAQAAYLLIFPQDPVRILPALREALAAGTKVIAFSPDIPADACTCAIYTSDRDIGRMAGDYIAAALKLKATAENQIVPTGRIVILRTDEDSPSSQARATAFLDSLSVLPGAVLVHDAPVQWTDDSAMARTREALRLQKKFDVIYAQNDAIAAAASRTILDSANNPPSTNPGAIPPADRQSMLILGTDGAPGRGAGLEMVVTGLIDATVCQPPLVDLAWREMQHLLSGAPAPLRRRTSVKPYLITPENAAKIQEQGPPEPEVVEEK